MAVAARRSMTTEPQPQILTDAQLARVGGGQFDIGGLIGSIGGMVDKFANTGGKASQIAGMVQKFLPSSGG
jgi:hypothetical protein